MNILLQTVKRLLQKCIDDIDNGTCNPSEDDMNRIIASLKEYNNKDYPISKYQACRHMNMSRASFDNYIREGKLPAGKKIAGFTEKVWFKKDLDKYIKR